MPVSTSITALSSLNSTDRAQGVRPAVRKVRTSRPRPMSQSLTVSSMPLDNTYRPSGLIATDMSIAECPPWTTTWTEASLSVRSGSLEGPFPMESTRSASASPRLNGAC